MIAIIATIRIVAGREQQFVEIFAARRRRVLAEEPITLESSLYLSDADPREFTVSERLASIEGHHAHLAASTDHLGMMACFDRSPNAKFVTAVDAVSPD